MKTKITLLLILSFCSLQSKSQILNGGFEDWTNFGAYSDPDHWYSFNYETANFGVIICEEGSHVSYLEGCTAPKFDTNQLHAAVVELIAHDNAEIKYSTVQNW